jgi:hypothetical protein
MVVIVVVVAVAGGESKADASKVSDPKGKKVNYAISQYTVGFAVSEVKCIFILCKHFISIFMSSLIYKDHLDSYMYYGF